MNYDKFKEDNKDCSCPNDSGEALSIYANTPEWLRRYCKVSLCKGCNCMTKTIKGKCGKCKADKLTKRDISK